MSLPLSGIENLIYINQQFQAFAKVANPALLAATQQAQALATAANPALLAAAQQAQALATAANPALLAAAQQAQALATAVNPALLATSQQVKILKSVSESFNSRFGFPLSMGAVMPNNLADLNQAIFHIKENIDLPKETVDIITDIQKTIDYDSADLEYKALVQALKLPTLQQIQPLQKGIKKIRQHPRKIALEQARKKSYIKTIYNIKGKIISAGITVKTNLTNQKLICCLCAFLNQLLKSHPAPEPINNIVNLVLLILTFISLINCPLKKSKR